MGRRDTWQEQIKPTQSKPTPITLAEEHAQNCPPCLSPSWLVNILISIVPSSHKLGDAYGGPVDGLSILGYKLSLNKNDVALLETQGTVKPKEFFFLQPNLVLFRLVQPVLGCWMQWMESWTGAEMFFQSGLSFFIGILSNKIVRRHHLVINGGCNALPTPESNFSKV